MSTKKTVQVPCSKCDGNGSIEGFGHIENGRCFRCAGAKVFEIDAEKYARDVAEQAKWNAFGRVESELSAWTGGYGSADRVALAIVAYGSEVKGLVGFYLRDNAEWRAELATAWRKANAAAKAGRSAA